MSQKEIDVIFVNNETGQPFARSLMPVNQLPTSFEAHTTFYIKDEDWELIEASSMTSEQFVEAGTLVLKLRKIETGYVQAKDILYTLPTINKEAPPIAEGSSKLDKQVLELHEDEWRQIELLSPTYQDDVIAHLKEIARIHNEQRVFNGVFVAFKEIYIREGISNPLKKKIKLSEVYSVLPPQAVQYDALAYENVAGLIEGGFAFRIDTLDFYGQQMDGIVNTLCLHSCILSYSLAAAAFLKQIMTQQELILIDWRRVTGLSPDGNNVEQYLQEVVSQNDGIGKRIEEEL
jgi:hypothetical protein